MCSRVAAQAIYSDCRISVNKDLILRERLALQRTVLANQATFLAFLRTTMYFAVAGLSVRGLLTVSYGIYFELAFYCVSVFLFSYGVRNYVRQEKSIRESERHIGDYKLDYEQ